MAKGQYVIRRGINGGIHRPEKKESKMDHDSFFKGFLVVWVVGIVLSLGVVGVVLWAIIRLVSKYT